MKDIKTFLIGFLTCTCMFLIMGQTEGNDQMEHVMKMVNQMKGSGLMPTPVSRYQGLVLGKKKEDVMLIDTQTGDLYELMGVSDETIWRKYRWHGQDFIKWKGLEKNK